MVSAKDIIKKVEGKFPQSEVYVPNISEISIGGDLGVIYQYVFGLTPQDSGEGYKEPVGLFQSFVYALNGVISPK